MKISTAIDNYLILRTLKPHEKLIVDMNTMELDLDMRYLQSFRRAYNNDCRKDLLTPIFNTFQLLDDNAMVSRKILIECVDHLFDIFAQTYPDFSEMTEILQNLKEQFSEIKLSTTQVVFVPQRVEIKEKDVLNTIFNNTNTTIDGDDEINDESNNYCMQTDCMQLIQKLWDNLKQYCSRIYYESA